MIPSKPDLAPDKAKNLMLALGGGNVLSKREATLFCQKNGIKISELPDLARRVAGPAPTPEVTAATGPACDRVAGCAVASPSNTLGNRSTNSLTLSARRTTCRRAITLPQRLSSI